MGVCGQHQGVAGFRTKRGLGQDRLVIVEHDSSEVTVEELMNSSDSSRHSTVVDSRQAHCGCNGLLHPARSPARRRDFRCPTASNR